MVIAQIVPELDSEDLVRPFNLQVIARFLLP